MAKFLQETLRESGLKANAHNLGSDAFKEFFCKVSRLLHCLQFELIDSPLKVRLTGESPSTEDIIHVAKLFDDDLTLDNLSRPPVSVYGPQCFRHR